ncbi:aminotransferase class V-fold PLP-dependent enzyme [Sungkyunkwania multivorans]|uniref:Aminotransferase class V-fold PLP-dependent enzyme n=1 Tax=Sungkyunkwania multivorans TaxID=1173618 RepID=A0ABW3CYN6_9FLAO
MENFRKQFPAIRNRIYLNTAAAGLLPESIVEWRQEHDLDLMLRGSVFREEQANVIEDVRHVLANFFNAKKENIALLPNFSYGFNLLLEGVDQATKFLLIESDYPSINWPVEQRGFSVDYARLDAQLEQNIMEAFERDVPDIFAFSLVQYTNGIAIDLQFLSVLKTTYPNTIFIADGTQFCGTCPVDFENAPIDILISSGYKWLLGGYGNGFLMSKETVQQRFTLRSIGFNSTNISFDKKKASFASRLEPGHQDSLVIGSLGEGVKFLNKVGLTTIQSYLNKLSHHCKDTLASRGLISDEIASRGVHSSIFNIKGDAALFQRLLANDVVCSRRGSGIRISLHFYNEMDDLERLFSILPS